MNKHEIGIAFQTNKPINEYGPLARLVENYGFHGVTVYNDLLYQPCWLPLLEIARYTKKIRIGPASVNPFTTHPLNIAGNIALIDECSYGRSYLGLARGAWLDYIGLEQKHAIQKLKDAMGCIRHLLKQRTDSYSSKHFPLKGGDSLRWKITRSDIPFLLGSWGPETIRNCIGEISEIKLGGTANSDVVPWIKKQITDAVLESKIEASNIGIVLGCVSVVDNDGEKARNMARKEVALYLPIVARLDPTLKIDLDLLRCIQKATSKYNLKEASEYIDDKLLEVFTLSGTPSEIAKQTLKLFNAGVNRVEFGTPHGLLNENKGLELLGKEVLPRLIDRIS